MDITFYLPNEPNFDEVIELDPDKDWQKYRRAQRWVAQTYKRLSDAGLPVKISPTLPENGCIVFHAKHKKLLYKELVKSKTKHTLVVIRGDKSQTNIADFEILQNSRWADNRKKFFIPYWPQPGLIQRDQARGSLVQNISFKGFDQNLNPYFHDPKWEWWLEQNGMKWTPATTEFYKTEETGVSVNWHDYSNVDIIVSYRPKRLTKHNKKNGLTSKPATKLYNA